MTIGGKVMTREKLSALAQGYKSSWGYEEPEENADPYAFKMTKEELRAKQITNELLTDVVN